MQLFKKTNQSLSCLFLVLVLVILAPAAIAYGDVSINGSIPGMQNVSTSGPCGWIVGFYNFALIAAGLLAFGSIVYGGLRYATSQGNPQAQSDGRSWIWSALIGTLLLAGAYVILYTVNPSLVTCQLPNVSKVGVAVGTTAAPPSTPAPSALAPGQCAGGPCQTLPSQWCQDSAKTHCGASAAMVAVVSCIAQHDPNFRVTEAMPPTDPHLDPAHNDGCAIDVSVGSGCSGIQPFENAAQACGEGPNNVLNEYADAKCPGAKSFATTKGNNIHLDIPHGTGGC